MKIDPKQGLLLVFPRDDAKKFFAARGDELMAEFLTEHIGTRAEELPYLSMEGLWHAVHALVCDGATEPDGGEMPLNHVVFGGRPMYSGDDKIVRLVRPDIVGHVAKAMKDLQPSVIEQTLAGINLSDLSTTDEHRDAISKESLLGLLTRVSDLYDKAAEQGAAVVFFADVA